MGAESTPKTEFEERRKVPRVSLGIRDAAASLGLSPRTVEELARTGELPGFRVGRRWLFAVASLREWALARTAAQRKEVRP